MTQSQCKCGQLLLGETRTLNDAPVCEACYQAYMTERYRLDNPFLAIKATFQVDWFGNDPDVVYLPFDQFSSDMEGDDVREMGSQVCDNLMNDEWAYGNMTILSAELVDVREEGLTINPKEQKKCEETSIWGFTELMYCQDVAHRPFENETEEVFLSYLFAQCYLGEVYSKDFRFYYCEQCNRWVCGQNPSNGWHSQVHISDDGDICCNKCYEETTLENGINDEFDGTTIPGQFYNKDEILEAGWEEVESNVMVESGYTGYRNPQYALDLIQGIIDSGKKCLVNYENMAIGGLGGYISVYQK